LYCTVLYWDYGKTYLSIRMHIATSVYANSVPMDIMSTRAFRSNNNAMKAEGKTESNIEWKKNI